MPFPASLTQTLDTFRTGPYPSATGLRRPITAGSVGEFFFALGWGWLMLVSFTGWGRGAAKLIRVERLPASVACSLGIAVVIFIGGWLNLLHAIYASVLVGLVGLGLLLYFLLWDLRPDRYRWLSFWKRAPNWPRVVILLTLLVMIFRVAATVRLATYHSYDDATAYLAFPQKMLMAHRFAADPFSDRRVISSLGGSYFLQTFVIAATSLSNVGMADRALGLMLMLVAIFDIGISFGLSARWMACMAFLAYLTPMETFNLTFIVLPISLFLAMIWTVVDSVPSGHGRRWQNAAIMGAIGGGAVCLKSTFLPYVGALALFPYIMLFYNKRMGALKLALFAGLACLAVLAAWMIAMKQASGTYLYPILGRGVDYSSYGLFPHLSQFAGVRAVVRAFLQGTALLVLAAALYFAGAKEDLPRLGLGVLIAAAIAITAFNYESGADYIWRYNFPQFLTAILIFFAATLSLENGRVGHLRQLNCGLAVAAMAGLIFYYDVGGGHFAPFNEMAREMALARCGLYAGLSAQPLESAAVLARYRSIQDALPANSVALVYTPKTFLLKDGGHKHFLIDDWPGAAGPKPGWPFAGDSGAVASYLRRNSVRFVIYDYAYGQWVDMISCQVLTAQAHFSQLDHALELLAFVTHHQFSQLRTTYKSVYDDGRIAVIDIATPVARSSIVGDTWTLHTSETEMCSEISENYIATHASYSEPANPSICE